MATSFLPQMTNSHSLIPFAIDNDCPDENSEIIHKIIINLKINLFKERKHIVPFNVQRNHLSHYLPVILLERYLNNQNYTHSEVGNKKLLYNFHIETLLENIIKIFVRRYKESQDRNKITAIQNTTYETVKNTAEYLWTKHISGKPIQTTSVNDELRNDITQFNNLLTRIIELKTEFKLTVNNIVRIVSEFRFLFWLDNIEHIDEKRIEFGQTYKEEIKILKQELKKLWDPEYYSIDIESILKVSSDSLNYIIGLDSNIIFIDQGQSGSTTFNHSKSMTSTSTPKDVQTNTSLQTKHKQ